MLKLENLYKIKSNYVCEEETDDIGVGATIAWFV